MSFGLPSVWLLRIVGTPWSQGPGLAEDSAEGLAGGTLPAPTEGRPERGLSACWLRAGWGRSPVPRKPSSRGWSLVETGAVRRRPPPPPAASTPYLREAGPHGARGKRSGQRRVGTPSVARNRKPTSNWLKREQETGRGAWRAEARDSHQGHLWRSTRQGPRVVAPLRSPEKSRGPRRRKLPLGGRSRV